MHGRLPLLQRAATELSTRLRPDDLARIVYFATEVVVASPFTRDVDVLRAALPESPQRRFPDATVLWRAVVGSMELFDAAAPERPVILVLSDGWDGDPFQPRVTMTDVIERAQRRGVMIYSIGMESRFPVDIPIDPHGPDAESLRHVANETGGGYLEVSEQDDLAAAFARVAEELHSQYLLGYVPPKLDGKEHRIGVRVNGSGLRVRARRGYVAPLPERAK